MNIPVLSSNDPRLREDKMRMECASRIQNLWALASKGEFCPGSSLLSFLQHLVLIPAGCRLLEVLSEPFPRVNIQCNWRTAEGLVLQCPNRQGRSLSWRWKTVLNSSSGWGRLVSRIDKASPCPIDPTAHLQFLWIPPVPDNSVLVAIFCSCTVSGTQNSGSRNWSLNQHPGL